MNISDSASIETFERRRMQVRYLNDDGIPETELVTRDNHCISVKSKRKYLELAVQDNYTVTRYFILRPGTIAEILSDRNAGFKIVQSAEYLLPYDENYPNQRNQALYGGAQPAIDELLRFWALLESNNVSLSSDTRLLRNLQVLKKKASNDLQKERQFLDSLALHNLISPPVAEYYLLKTAFDSIKITTYPDFTLQGLLESTKAIDIVKPSNFTDWTKLTFYHDWVVIHYQHLYEREIKSFEEFQNVYNIIKTETEQENQIRDKLLLIHILEKWATLSLVERQRVVDRFTKDTGIPLESELLGSSLLH
jgi:hypothetical protein